MMIIQRALLLLLLVAAFAGCASNPGMKDTATLPPGQGVMVARLAIPYLAQRSHLKTTISSCVISRIDHGIPPMP